ncbi:MAG: FecR domain-containing protein [Roseburia sp.]
MEEAKKKNMKLIIGIVAAAVLLLVAIIVFFVTHRNQGYRLIQIYELDGKAVIERENTGSIDAYENLNLLSGDLLRVLEESRVRLKMDEDKYMLVEPESVLTIFATGNNKNSKTNIELQEGAITIEIQNKLSDASSYEVTTPNSVMAVRGTVFYISVEFDENGDPITRLDVFEGKVVAQSIDEDGNLSEEYEIESGKEVIIKKDKDDVVVIISDEIDYSTLSTEVLEYLEEIAEAGRELSITPEELNSLIQERITDSENEDDKDSEIYTVTFQYQGKTFGVQEVKAGDRVTMPKLLPAQSGTWNFDFDTPIEEDTVIVFQAD